MTSLFLNSKKIIIAAFCAGVLYHAEINNDLRFIPQHNVTLLQQSKQYAWTNNYEAINSLQSRIKTPETYSRAYTDNFSLWLQGLPLLEGRPDVLLYNGEKKSNQAAQYAIINIDVGNSDLQQCADAVMRLRAEYLFGTGQYSKIHFNFTSGFRADYIKWAEGNRIQVKGNQCTWVKTAAKDYSHATFRQYLNKVFMYAGTYSLSQELVSINIKEIQPGDVFIHGGFPGHAVMVVDVVKNTSGKKMYMLAQSYMPAQQIHILNNPGNSTLSPWYPTNDNEFIVTPEWTFKNNELKRWGE